MKPSAAKTWQHRYVDDADAADFHGFFFLLIRADPLPPRHPRINVFSLSKVSRHQLATLIAQVMIRPYCSKLAACLTIAIPHGCVPTVMLLMIVLRVGDCAFRSMMLIELGVAPRSA